MAVWVAVDIHQMWSAAQAEFGDRNRLDLQKLKKTVNEQFPAHEIHFHAYILDIAANKNDRFFQILKHLGFSPHYAPSYRWNNKTKSTASVKMAVDAMQAYSDIEHFIFASGDGDLIPLVDFLRKTHKDVEVWTFREEACGDLLKSASHVYFLNQGHIYGQGHGQQSDSSTD